MITTLLRSGVIIVMACFGAAAQATVAGEDAVSNLKLDERVVCFPTDARLSRDTGEWIIPVHVWVHELEAAPTRRRAIAAVLKARYGLSVTAVTADNFQHRTRLIVADNERGKRIVVLMAGRRFELPETAPNGHAVGEFRLETGRVAEFAGSSGLSYSVVLPNHDNRKFEGTVRCIPRNGLSVISDFDDTVRIAHVTDRAMLLGAALYQDFQAVPGMAELYQEWADHGAMFHFVSSSPWHLFEPMDDFLTQHEFPERSMTLKHFRFKDASLMNLFIPGTKSKPAQIRRILTAYPERRFILVGDSGEFDPEVYAELLRAFPGQIESVLIRNVTAAKRDDQRFGQLFEGINPAKWILFDDPSQIPPYSTAEPR